MSRFSDSDSKLERFRARNEGQLLRGFVREALSKAYLRPKFRNFVRPFVPLKKPEKWLFVVGCFNSGTTILRRLLESHPDISALAGEGAKLTSAFPDLEEGGWPRMMYANRSKWTLPESGATERARMAQRDWSIWFDRRAKVFFEKSIDHTTRMEWLDRHFPNTYFIAITRNGYCVNEGIMRRARPFGRAREQVGSTYPPELVAEQWVAFDETIRTSAGNVSRFHSLRYEDLTSDPANALARIFRFLDLSVPEMRWTAPVMEIGAERHELIDQNERSLARLCDEDIAKMRLIMGDAMTRNGYEPNP